MFIKAILRRKTRILLKQLVITDFKLRYQSSVLGYVWSLLRPLFLFAILYTVFGLVLKFSGGIQHFGVYLLLGIIMWSFFVEATNNGLSSIVARGDLIRKINFPKFIIVISGTISALINLLLSLIIVLIFCLLDGVNFHWHVLLFPLVVIELYIFALAIAFFLSAAYVKFRDIGYIWEVLLQAAFYATPIIYSFSLVTGYSSTLAKILALNPVTQAIQDARYLLVNSEQTVTLQSLFSNNRLIILAPLLIILITSILSSAYFRKNAKYFAEQI